MTLVLQVLMVVLLLNAVICLVRAWMGPTLADRVLAMNVVGTKTLVVLVMVAYAFGFDAYVDVAIVYGLLNYVATLAVSRLIETGGLKDVWGWTEAGR